MLLVVVLVNCIKSVRELVHASISRFLLLIYTAMATSPILKYLCLDNLHFVVPVHTSFSARLRSLFLAAFCPVDGVFVTALAALRGCSSLSLA